MNVAVCTVAAAVAFFCGASPQSLAGTKTLSPTNTARARVQAQRQKLVRQQPAAPSVTTVTRTPSVGQAAVMAAAPGGAGFAPEYDFTLPNYANSPELAKFVDPLPGLCSGADNPGFCIPIAKKFATPPAGVPNDADYYEIGLKDYTQKMHRDLAATPLRGYRDLNPAAGGTSSKNTYLGPIIVATKNRPVRIRFTNELDPASVPPIPVDESVMGAGMWEKGDVATGTTVGNFSKNRAGLHLHGGLPPWISDGTAHQWVPPANEPDAYGKGVSTRDVPDMPPTLENEATYYYPNSESARLMFYHDHAYGITRLNVYLGEAAGYVLTDATEQQMITDGLLPDIGVPLVIQDKSFVHVNPTADTAYAAWRADATGTVPPPTSPPSTQTVDPLWTSDAPAKSLLPGALWFPHVYVPNQDPYHWYTPADQLDGMNPMGRWDYGPWIWPPVQVPAGNLYNLPHPSIAPEAFMDTMIVNGKVYPYMDVGRRAYRFRILNAANDRFMNLQLYYAYAPNTNEVCDGKQKKTAICTEIKMVPANGAVYTLANGTTFQVEGDTRDGGVPDPRTSGPMMLQIGTEGGFLPEAVRLNAPAQPVGFDRDPKSMTVGNVAKSTILLGPAERADVVVDMTNVPTGARLILYNDAPAALPAGDKRYDYYYGNADQQDMGGAPPTKLGFGPNTRTIMQFRATGALPGAGYRFAGTTALANALPAAYKAAQDAPLIPQHEYDAAYPGVAKAPNYGKLYDTQTFTYVDEAGTTQTLPIFQKAIAEEFDPFGRMSAVLGTEAMIAGNQGQNTFGFMYVDPATEKLPAGVTQIWKLTHNGVDTHAIHFHLINVQILNRVDWAGVIKPADPNELGWKETVRMNPLEDIILAVRAKVPPIPFTVGDSVRPRDPMAAIGATIGTNPWPYVKDPANAQPFEFNVEDPNGGTPTINEMANFGWEYTWHCHLLGHEENDMMRPLVMIGADQVASDKSPPTVTATLVPAANAAGWNNANPTIVNFTAMDVGRAGLAFITVNGVDVPGSDTGSATLSVTAQGTSNVTYSATDKNSNSSATFTQVVKLDSIAPVVTNVAATKGSGSVTISGTVILPTASEAPLNASGSYTMTGTATASGSFSINAAGTFSFTRSKMKNGAYVFTLRVGDAAGNVTTQTVNVTLP